MDPPGHGIPLYDVHPEATAVANGLGRQDREGPGLRPSSWADTAAPDRPELKPLPRQSGALWDDYLGRDELGIKLVTRPMARPDRPGGPGPAGG